MPIIWTDVYFIDAQFPIVYVIKAIQGIQKILKFPHKYSRELSDIILNQWIWCYKVQRNEENKSKEIWALWWVSITLKLFSGFVELNNLCV